MEPGFLVVSQEAKLAQSFLAGLSDPRAAWADLYERFADEQHLSPELRRAVRLTVLRLRVFHAAQTFRPRPRRRRC